MTSEFHLAPKYNKDINKTNRIISPDCWLHADRRNKQQNLRIWTTICL